jgi:hypothetical protein
MTLTMCSSVPAAEAGVDERYCAHRYTIDAGRVPVCSTMPLADAQLGRLERNYLGTRSLYAEFASAEGLAYDARALDPPTIHVVRFEQMNDRVAFPRAASVGNILGRYIVGRRWVFITERALVEGPVIHLAHELAHWIHDGLGIAGAAERDEMLARAFHRYYRSRITSPSVEGGDSTGG